MFSVLRLTGFRLLGVAGLVLSATWVHAAEPTQNSTAPGAASTLSQSKKSEVDAATRQGMDNIRDVMAAHQERIAKEQLNAQDYQQLADVIDKNVAAIMTHRTLNEKARKEFNQVVMLDLNHNVALMRSGSTLALPRVGALGMLQILRNYGKYFQHPGVSF